MGFLNKKKRFKFGKSSIKTVNELLYIITSSTHSPEQVEDLAAQAAKAAALVVYFLVERLVLNLKPET